MNEVTSLEGWRKRAEEHLAVAQSALRRKTPWVAPACLQVRQAIEDYVEAAKAARRQGLPKINDLQPIANQAAPLGILIPLTADQMKALSSYSVQVLYPGADPILAVARTTLALTRGGRRYVRNLLGLQ